MQELLQKYLWDKVPYLAGLRVSDLHALTEGWECDVYSFVIRYSHREQECQRELILRVYQGKDVPFAPKKHVNEYRVIQQLQQDGYPVPAVLLLETDSCYLGNPFIIMEKIAGQLLGQRMSLADADERARLSGLFTELMAELHNIDIAPYLLDEKRTPETITHEEVRRYQELEESFGCPCAVGGLQWLKQAAHNVSPGKLALAHWDFHPYNIIVDEEGDPYVIDWTLAEVTDRRLDLAWSMVLLGQAAGEQLLKSYEALIGEPLEDMDFFLAMACFRRLLSIRISLQHGAEALGMRPGAEKVMAKEKHHIEEVYQRWLAITGVPIE